MSRVQMSGGGWVQGVNVQGGYPGANAQGGCPGGTCPGGKRLEGETAGGGGANVLESLPHQL